MRDQWDSHYYVGANIGLAEIRRLAGRSAARTRRPARIHHHGAGDGCTGHQHDTVATTTTDAAKL